MKYAIYKSKCGGVYYFEYYDNPEEIKKYPYINNAYLPIKINAVGGYTSFDLEYEKKQGFIEFRDEKPDFEEMFPKNAENFKYGFIATDGTTYSCDYQGHYELALAIYKHFRYDTYNYERTLEEKGFIRVSDNPRGKRTAYILKRYTKSQEKVLLKYRLI